MRKRKAISGPWSTEVPNTFLGIHQQKKAKDSSHSLLILIPNMTAVF
jgi:hypothetical protein